MLLTVSNITNTVRSFEWNAEFVVFAMPSIYKFGIFVSSSKIAFDLLAILQNGCLKTYINQSLWNWNYYDNDTNTQHPDLGFPKCDSYWVKMGTFAEFRKLFRIEVNMANKPTNQFNMIHQVHCCHVSLHGRNYFFSSLRRFFSILLPFCLFIDKSLFFFYLLIFQIWSQLSSVDWKICAF